MEMKATLFFGPISLFCMYFPGLHWVHHSPIKTNLQENKSEIRDMEGLNGENIFLYNFHGREICCISLSLSLFFFPFLNQNKVKLLC